MPSPTILRPMLLLSLLSTMTFSFISLQGPEQQSDALPRYLTEPTAAPNVQTFVTGANYDLQVSIPKTYHQHVPDYGTLRTAAAGYAQGKIVALYAQADAAWQTKRDTMKKNKRKTSQPAKIDTVQPSIAQWTCLNNLWTGESGWQVYAVNKKSGAYGIAQALPAIKMAKQGKDWRDNYKTQVDWGLTYITARYGTPCDAWTAWQARSPHWY